MVSGRGTASLSHQPPVIKLGQTMSSTKKRTTKGTAEAVAQQSPCGKSRQETCPTEPTKANKIALVISLTMLLAWIGFLAALAMSK